jgi:hypothetical protein
VEALVAAHADFEASVVAAGWKPVITDGPWYATSFVWEPKPRGASGDPPERQSDSWAATSEDEADRELHERFRPGRNERHAERT